MELIVDIGNTNIKLGVFQNNKLLKKSIYGLKNISELSTIFSIFPTINQVFFCGEDNNLLEEIYNISKDKNVIITNWKDIKKDIIKMEYDNINTLGFDRLGVSVGAAFLYPKYKNHLVIDIGSCITYDCILNNIYKGGQISPGIKFRLQSLASFTTNLPKLHFRKPNILLGNSTVDSIQSGVYFGICDEIKSRIEFYQNEVSELNVILTGGDALHFEKIIKNVIFDYDLLMKGLNLLLNYNVEK